MQSINLNVNAPFFSLRLKDKQEDTSLNRSRPETIGSRRPGRTTLPPPKPGRTRSTTHLPTTTSKPELPTCKKKRICSSKRNSEDFRELAVALHKELREELDIDTSYLSDDGLKDLDLVYDCKLEKLAYQRIQGCKKALYSSKTHNSAVIRRHLGQEKVLAFSKAFSYWRNGREKRTNEDFKPHTEYDKLSWDSLSAIGCAVKQCRKRGERFTLVDCKYDYE
ncbi:unnamed protein product [Cylicocyclus nassatus]|uniref:SCP domain-containing protein n=1 Tax=Cylicocyclus nassatus TaxID=53992 RepID=A0AA36GNX7_CYLNA|nr:unnamed protein product [Cylicocyclus nassatus]